MDVEAMTDGQMARGRNGWVAEQRGRDGQITMAQWASLDIILG